MSEHAKIALIETIREEIRLIQNQELFYRKKKWHTFTQRVRHGWRLCRLLEIQEAVERLRGLK